DHQLPQVSIRQHQLPPELLELTRVLLPLLTRQAESHPLPHHAPLHLPALGQPQGCMVRQWVRFGTMHPCTCQLSASRSDSSMAPSTGPSTSSVANSSPLASTGSPWSSAR